MSLAASDELLHKYNTAGPRYTSYPTAPVWTETYDAPAHAATIRETNAGGNPHPLSLYAHLPFCEHRCLFCGCNVVITQQREQAEKYLGYLFREIDMVAGMMADAGAGVRPVVQFHWGGGTPTYLSEDQMVRLFRFQTERFPLAENAEVAIEVDPRVTTNSQITVLHELGFNRISLGVQDFNPTVQETIERIQPYDMTAATVAHCRSLGFEGLNFDLIYGLPYQTVEGFAKTLEQVLTLEPDRIALYNYAHVPWMAPHQNKIPEESLPGAETKFEVLKLALDVFTRAGYRYIGMDHFAKPDDELSIALDNGQLHRNFMGYTVQKTAQHGTQASDLYGFGVSAISAFQRQFAQNWRKLSQYYEAIDVGRLPTMRGYVLTDEDKLRQEVIMGLLCQGRLAFADFEARYGIEFAAHFADALAKLQGMATDGLVVFENGGLTVTPLGRLFSRNIAMPFDAYLDQPTEGGKPIYSKTV